MAIAEKKAKSLQKELAKLKSYTADIEKDHGNWLQEREAELDMRYKAKKESLRAQLRSKQTDYINQLAAAMGLDSYRVFEEMKLQRRISSERSAREQTTSDDDGDLYGELPTGLSKLITSQPLTATFQYLLSLISSMQHNRSSPNFK